MLNERDGGIGGVKLVGRGMRDRLRHQEGRRVLRVGQGQEPGGRQSVFDRHHAAADPEGGGRQDPDPVDGLRPVGLGGRQRSSRGSSIRRRPIGTALSMIFKLHRRQGRRPRQAQGQDHRLHLSRRAATAASRSRCSSSSPRITASTVKLYPVPASRNAEPVGAMAQRAPRPAGLDDHVGLGRDEPDRRQGSGQDQLSRWTSSSASGGRAATTMRAPAAQAPRAISALNFNGVGTNYPGASRTSRSTSSTRARARSPKDKVGENLYNRGVYNSVLIAEAIRNAQKLTGKKVGDRRGRAARPRDAQHHRGALEGDRPAGFAAPIKRVLHRP